MSSEVDAALRDEEYDVDDYETDSDDDVIDISSGSEIDHVDQPIICKSRKSPTVNLSLPPCNTLGKKAFMDTDVNVFNVPVDVSATTTEIVKTTPVDESKCSEISFLTVSESSVKHLASAHTIDSPLQLDEKDVLVSEDVQMSDAPITVVDPVEKDSNNATELSEVINVDFNQQHAVAETDLFLSQNEVAATFVLQDNLLSSIGDEMNPTDTPYVDDTHTDFVIGDLNTAVMHSENVDVTEETLTQSHSDVISPSQDTVSTLTEVKCDVAEVVDQNMDVVTSEETLIKSGEVSVSVEQLPDGTDFTSTTVDLNAAVLQDNTLLQDSSQQTAVIEVLMDTYDQNIMVDSTSGNLNKAILLSQSCLSESHAAPEMTMETNPTTTLVEEFNQQTEDVVLDIDEILESAIVPDVNQNDNENVQLQDVEQKPSTSADALKKSLSEEQSTTTPKRRLRSNSLDVSGPDPVPGMLTRKRSGSFTPVRNSPVLRSAKESIITANAEPGTSSTQRTTRAKSELKNMSNDDSATAVRNTRAKSEAKSFSKGDKATPTRNTRTKSEARTTSNDNGSTPVGNTTAKSEIQTVTNVESNDAIQTKMTRANSRSKLNLPVAATSEKESDKTFPANVEKIVNVPRTRSQSITEDNDDTASIASGNSVKSTKSTTSTTSTTSKRTRKTAKALPVISEDLSEEAGEESQAYADTRR